MSQFFLLVSHHTNGLIFNSLTYKYILFANAIWFISCTSSGCAGETRHVVPSPIQTGQAARRNDDRTPDRGDAQLSDRADGNAAFLPVDQHEEDVRNGNVFEQRDGRGQRRRGHRLGRQRRRRQRRRRHVVDQRQRERDRAHHIARFRRYDTHEETQRRRPIQNRVQYYVIYVTIVMTKTIIHRQGSAVVRLAAVVNVCCGQTSSGVVNSSMGDHPGF